MVEYYDYVLALIPVTLLGLGAGLTAVGLSAVLAVSIASAVTIGVMGHALFVNSPVEAGSEDAVPDASGRSVAGDASQAAD